MSSLKNYDELDDEQLVHRTSTGDDLAFRALIQRHLQPLRSFLALRAPVPDLIDEVAHDAFVFAYRHMDDFTGGSVQAWVRAIAFNHLRDRMKAHARETVRRERYGEHLRWQLAVEGTETEPGDEAEHLKDCLETLPSNLREVVRLRYERELTSDAIGAQLGRSAMAIRTLLVRVRHQLRQCIEAKMQTN